MQHQVQASDPEVEGEQLLSLVLKEIDVYPGGVDEWYHWQEQNVSHQCYTQQDYSLCFCLHQRQPKI